MSSPDDSERSDDASNSDYAPKWARDRYRQANPDRAKGEPPHLTFLRSLEQFPERAQSLDPETVDSPSSPEVRVVRYQRRLRHCGGVRSYNRVVIHW
jgi:hypothetical protein